MQAYKLVSLVGMLGVALALSACDASTPSQVQTGKIRVGDRMITETLDTGHSNASLIDTMAKNIQHNGKGGVSLTVPYVVGSEAAARSQGEAYKKEFQKRGVADVSMAMVPVLDTQYAGKIVVAYEALTAVPAAGCTRIPGYQGTDNLDAMERYQFGCETQADISKMISDPSDLLGKGGSQDNDSRRSGTIIEPYRAGTPNPPMKGYSASSIGNK